MSEIGKMYVKLGMDSSGFKKGLNEASSKLSSTAQSMKSVGNKLTLGVTAPILGAAGASLTFAVKFNEAMANVQSLGVPIQRVKELKEGIQKLAVDTGKSTTDLANGMYQVVSAFGDSADSMNVLTVAAKSAKAGLATTQDSVNLLSSAIKGYGLSTKDAQAVSDKAFETVKLGQTTYAELASSMGKVIPMAAALGVSQDTLWGSMATLTGVTGDTAEVTTQLRATFQAIMKPTTDMSSAIGEVANNLIEQGKLTGPIVDDYKKQRDELSKMLLKYDALEKAGKGNTSEAKNLKKAIKEQSKAVEDTAAALGPAIIKSQGFQATLKDLTETAHGNKNELGKMFGSVESLNAVLALTGPQADTWKEKVDKMSQATGASTEAFKAQTQGINSTGFEMAQMKEKLMVLAQKLGDALIPALTKALDALQPLIDMVAKGIEWFNDLDPSMQKVIIALAGLAAATGPVLSVVGSLTTALPLLGTAFTVATGPIGIITAAIAGIVTAGVLVYQNWDTIKAKLTEVWNAIKKAAELVWGKITKFFKSVWDVLTKPWKKIWDTLTGNLSDKYDGIKEAGKTAFKKIIDFFSSIWDALSDAWGTAWDGITRILTDVWDGIKTTVETVWNAIKGILEVIFGGIGMVFSGDWSGIKDTLNLAWQGIKTLADTVWSGIKNFFSGIWDGMKDTWNKAWDGIKGGLGKAWDGIAGTAKKTWGGIKDYFGGVWDKITGKTKDASDDIKTLVQGLGDKSKEIIQTAMEKTGSIVNEQTIAIVKNFLEMDEGATGVTDEMATNVLKALANMSDEAVGHSIIPDMNDAIVASFEGMKNSVLSTANELHDDMSTKLYDMQTVSVGHVQALSDNSVAIMETMRSDIDTKMDAIHDSIVGKTKKALDTSTTDWNNWQVDISTALDKAGWTIADFSTNAANALVTFFDDVASGKKTFEDFNDVIREFLLKMLSALEVQVLAQQAAGIATAVAEAPATMGASLAAIPVILAQAATAAAVFETLKWGVRQLFPENDKKGSDKVPNTKKPTAPDIDPKIFAPTPVPKKPSGPTPPGPNVINPTSPSNPNPPAPHRPTKLASGGIITKPLNAIVGEAGPEAVIPLKKAPMGMVINMNIYGSVGVDDIAEKLVEQIQLKTGYAL